MPRKSRADFKRDDTYAPYELELDSGDIVTFANPNRMDTESSFDLANNTDPYAVFERLLGDDYGKFWGEWRDAPANETNALLEDVFSHYGTRTGNREQRRAAQRA